MLLMREELHIFEHPVREPDAHPAFCHTLAKIIERSCEFSSLDAVARGWAGNLRGQLFRMLIRANNSKLLENWLLRLDSNQQPSG
jgi:hypothetical protein